MKKMKPEAFIPIQRPGTLQNSLLRGLDEKDDKVWIERQLSQMDSSIQTAQFIYPSFPLIKGKKLDVEIHPFTEQIYFVLTKMFATQSKLRLTVEEFKIFNSQINFVLNFIEAVQKDKILSFVSDGGFEAKFDKYGWSYFTIDLNFTLKLLLSWKDGNSRVRVCRISEPVYDPKDWTPDPEREMFLSAGTFTHYVKHVYPKAINALRMWKDSFNFTKRLKASLLSSYTAGAFVDEDSWSMSIPLEDEIQQELALSTILDYEGQHEQLDESDEE
jgi:hypothetical protein